MKASLAYWRGVLRDAERELDAAATVTAMKAAATRLMRAKAEIGRLQGRGGQLSY